MKTSNRTLRLLLSHLCAVAIGSLAVLQWEAIVVTKSSSVGSATNDCSDVPLAARHVVDDQSTRNSRHHYDLLPIIVLDGVPKATHMHKMLLNAKPRISLPPKHNLPVLNKNSTRTTPNTNSMPSIGPFHVFYPSSKHNKMQDWLQKDATSLLKDETFVLWEPVTNTSNRRDIMYSLHFWKRLADMTTKVLLIDGSAVLCGNPTSSVWDFVEHYDWIGAAWKWAADPKSPLHKGGNGALSIRNPQHLATILQEGDEISVRGNEDMWFVRHLHEWAQKGDTRHGIAPPVLPPYEHQIRFAVEEVAPSKDIVPVGVYHLMRTMDYKDRDGLLRRCPEATSLFDPLHEGRCAVLQCPKNMSIGYFEMKKMEEHDKNSVEKCDILYHPVAASKNWTE